MKSIKTSRKAKQSKPKNEAKSLPKGYISNRSVKKVSNAWYWLYHDDCKEVGISQDEFYQICLKTTEVYHHLIKHHGINQGTKQFKDLRTYYIRYVLGLKTKQPIGLSTTSKGFPRLLSHLRKLSKAKYLPITMSCLNLTRLSCVIDNKHNSLKSIRLKTPITKKAKALFDEFDEFLKVIFKDIHIERKVSDHVNMKIITSKGPNSNISKTSATYSSVYDAVAIAEDPILFKNIKNLANRTNSLGLVHYIHQLNKKYKSRLKDVKETCHSRIAIMPNSENKSRIVAIVDYFSQTLLGSLVPVLDELEGKLPNSYMFDQDKGRECARLFTLTGNPVSCDASDFTDRLPYQLQQIVLKHLLKDDELARSYISVLRSRGFKAPGFNKRIWYGAGQPMGANGSFQLANATHALIAMFCSYKTRNRINTIEKLATMSCVVGDDIVFKYNKCAVFYKAMCKEISLPLSETKGFTSAPNVKVAEFCKRTYCNGKLVSGLSPRPTLNFINDYKHVFSFLQNTGMDATKLNQVLDRLHPRYKDDVNDLIIATEFYKVGDITSNSKFSPSETMQQVIDDFGQFTEHTRIGVSRAVMYLTFYATALAVARQVQAIDIRSLSNDLLDLEGGVMPPSDIDPISMCRHELTKVMEADILGVELPFLQTGKDDLTEKPWPPFVHLTAKLQVKEMTVNPVDSTNYVNQLLGGEIAVSELISQSWKYHELVEEVKADLFGQDSFSFANSPLGDNLQRVDERKRREIDKTLFLFAKRLISVLDGYEYSVGESKITAQLDKRFPKFELYLRGLPL